MIFSPRLFNIFFQNKHYKLKEELTEDEQKTIEKSFQEMADQFHIEESYKNEFFEILEYFSQFEKNVIFDADKKNPIYTGISYIRYILILAQEALEKLEQINKDNKSIAYYEQNKSASIDDLIELYKKKLAAQGEHKISTIAAKNEIQLKKHLAKLKKHDTLFMNFYLMFYTLYPLKESDLKKEDQEYVELLQDLFEFFSTGHATREQIQKSVAIQTYDIYKVFIAKKNLPNKTTDTELQERIGKLIDLIFQTTKHFQNFNKNEQEAYIKNIVYNFPVFDYDTKMTEKQIRRFKFYMIGKNAFVPKYIPKFFRRWILNKIVKTPLSFYRKSLTTILFGLFQKKI
jgi:hypothetical protein